MKINILFYTNKSLIFNFYYYINNNYILILLIIKMKYLEMILSFFLLINYFYSDLIYYMLHLIH